MEEVEEKVEEEEKKKVEGEEEKKKKEMMQPGCMVKPGRPHHRPNHLDNHSGRQESACGEGQAGSWGHWCLVWCPSSIPSHACTPASTSTT